MSIPIVHSGTGEITTGWLGDPLWDEPELKTLSTDHPTPVSPSSDWRATVTFGSPDVSANSAFTFSSSSHSSIRNFWLCPTHPFMAGSPGSALPTGHLSLFDSAAVSKSDYFCLFCIFVSVYKSNACLLWKIWKVQKSIKTITRFFCVLCRIFGELWLPKLYGQYLSNG